MSGRSVYKCMWTFNPVWPWPCSASPGRPPARGAVAAAVSNCWPRSARGLPWAGAASAQTTPRQVMSRSTAWPTPCATDLGSAETAALLAKLIEETDLACSPSRRAAPAPGQPGRLHPAGPEARAPARRTPTSWAWPSCSNLDAPRTIALPAAGSRGPWELRRSVRERGGRTTLVVLSDVSRALREEERQAWQRLVRVLSHEIIQLAGADLVDRRHPAPDPHGDPDPPDLGRRRGARLRSSSAAPTRCPFMTAPRDWQAAAAERGASRWGRGCAAWCLRSARRSRSRPAPRTRWSQATAAQLEQLLINWWPTRSTLARDRRRVRGRWSCAAAGRDRVSDEGPGWPTPPTVRSVLHHQAEGSGIGLALSRQIADAHRGSLRSRTGAITPAARRGWACRGPAAPTAPAPSRAMTGRAPCPAPDRPSRKRTADAAGISKSAPGAGPADAGTGDPMTTLLQDVRFASGYAEESALSGSPSSPSASRSARNEIFSVVNAVRLQPLPSRSRSRLVACNSQFFGAG